LPAALTVGVAASRADIAVPAVQRLAIPEAGPTLPLPPRLA